MTNEPAVGQAVERYLNGIGDEPRIRPGFRVEPATARVKIDLEVA
jgi:hypothetical protein